MNILHFKKLNNIKHKKEGRVNPHKFWTVFVIVTTLLLTVVVFYFAYFFSNASYTLDKEVETQFNTNTGEIEIIEELIKKTEEATMLRVKGLGTSQNESSIVQ